MKHVRRRLRRGLLHRLHRGVYAFGALSPAPEQRWAAALLAAGDGSALSNTTAATAFGQLPVRSVIEVTAPTHRRGDEMLRVRWRQDVDTTWHRGLRVTTPAQTLLDLAAARWPIDRMTHDMAASGHVSLSDLKAFAHNRRGEPGARALREALALPHTRSGWERESGGPDHDLVTEQTHGTAWKRRDDADRDAWLESIGKEVWRVRTIDAALERRLRHRLRP